jgi:hypothetical protein
LLHAIHDTNCWIGSVGNQTALIRMNCFEHAFSGKRIAVNEIEGTAIEGETAGVLDPESA